MNYKLILYDLDGTLLDYETAEQTSLWQTCREFGIDFSEAAVLREYKKINGEIWRDFERGKITSVKLRTERFRRLFNNSEAGNFQPDLSIDLFSKSYLNNLSQSAVLIGEAEIVLSHFQGKIIQAIVSNGLADVQYPRIRNSILNKYFGDIFISEEIGYAKPDPGIFNHIFSSMEGISPDTALIVGDNLNSDIKGGKDFGIDTCWFNPNNLPNETGIEPTYIIENLSELKKIIDLQE